MTHNKSPNYQDFLNLNNHFDKHSRTEILAQTKWDATVTFYE
jgi:hypothetical protein